MFWFDFYLQRLLLLEIQGGLGIVVNRLLRPWCGEPLEVFLFMPGGASSFVGRNQKTQKQ